MVILTNINIFLVLVRQSEQNLNLNQPKKCNFPSLTYQLAIPLMFAKQPLFLFNEQHVLNNFFSQTSMAKRKASCCIALNVLKRCISIRDGRSHQNQADKLSSKMYHYTCESIQLQLKELYAELSEIVCLPNKNKNIIFVLSSMFCKTQPTER